MNPEPDDINNDSEWPAELEIDAEGRRAAELERIHQEIVKGEWPHGERGERIDMDSAEDLDAAVRLLGMIEHVRRNVTRSDPPTTSSTGGGHQFETPNLRENRATQSATDHVSNDANGPDHSGLSPFEPAPMRHIGRFEIVRKLGSGGCGIVFLANDPQLNRQVAIKVPRPESMASSDGARRFLREAQAAALLTHPNIVTVYEAGRHGPILYMASEWVDGPTLSRWIEEHPGSTDFRDIAAMVATLADAIQHAHLRSVIHRDLKPANILLDLPGATGLERDHSRKLLASYVRVSDFGMARLLSDDGRITRSGDLVGTPSYLAPELISSSSDIAGPGTDIYGLGTILYELLTGQPPFQRSTLAATLRAVETEDPVAPCQLRGDVPKDLDAICLKCLEKNPEQRYSSAFELAQDLNAWLDGRTVKARHQTLLEKSSRWISRNRIVTMLTSAVLLSVLTGLAVASSQWFRAERALVEVRRQRDRAEWYLDRAEQSVDMLPEDVEEVLEPVSGVQGFRKNLLTKALVMQQELLDNDADSTDQPIRTAKILQRAADINRHLGKQPESLAQLHRLIELLSSAPLREQDRDAAVKLANSARVSICEILHLQRKHAEVEKLIRPALENLGKQPPDEGVLHSVLRAGMYRSLARSLVGQNRKEEARAALQAAEQAVIRFPLDRDHLAVIKVSANIQNSLSTICMSRTEDWPAARIHLQKAIQLNETYLSLSPDNHTVRANLVQARTNLASLEVRENHLEAGDSEFRSAADEARRLVADFPLIRRYRERLLHCLSGLSLINIQLKRPDEALLYIHEGIELADAIHSEFGETAVTLDTRGHLLSQLGDVRAKLLEDFEGAETAYLDGIAAGQHLVSSYPGSASFHALLGATYWSLGELMMKQDNIDEALEAHRAAAREGRISLDLSPDDSSQRERLAIYENKLCEIYARLGRHDDAITNTDAALKLYPNHRIWEMEAAEVMSTCAAIVSSQAEKSDDEQNSDRQVAIALYQDLAVDHVGRAIELGYANPKLLATDPRLSSIHNHPGFLQLMSLVE